MQVGTYISLVKDAHAAKGGIAGQREALKTTSAKRIRERMVSDIRQGAVLPPVVLGIVISQGRFEDLSNSLPQSTTLLDDILREEQSRVTIIDGMQRTTALIEAMALEPDLRTHPMRVEFWISPRVESLIYRMLVLNTGQVPWTLGRQLSVVYAPLLEDISTNVQDIGRVFTPDMPGRRVQPGEFSADALVELYISFSLRKTTVDTKEALSDEFSRLDFVDNLAQEAFQKQFYRALSIMVKLDKSFSAYDSGQKSKLAKGRNIFDSQPARIGLMVAIAQQTIGRPGMERSEPEREERLQKIEKDSAEFCSKLDAMTPDQLADFLRLDVLAEVLDRRVGQVGRYERGVYFDAFSVLIQESFKVPNLEPCWRAS